MSKNEPELTGPALDFAVAKGSGITAIITPSTGMCQALYRDHDHPNGRWAAYCPTTDWSLAGPIIDREFISVRKEPFDGEFIAHCCFVVATATGKTYLEAAMRCFVASKLGETA